ncbi:hypothetical protein HK102_004535 [Quaeritorhiza haematococci]|nr:hypothetical protein HK102_004535 [Quaeritorhiza haematococci]
MGSSFEAKLRDLGLDDDVLSFLLSILNDSESSPDDKIASALDFCLPHFNNNEDEARRYLLSLLEDDKTGGATQADVPGVTEEGKVEKEEKKLTSAFQSWRLDVAEFVPGGSNQIQQWQDSIDWGENQVDEELQLEENEDWVRALTEVDDIEYLYEDCDALSPSDLLKTLFVHLPQDLILSLLESNHYNMERTLESIMQLSDEKQTKSAAGSPATSPSSKTIRDPPSTSYQQHQRPSGTPQQQNQICRHFLAGSCLRKDCWFSHDLQSTVCKFWLQGSCFKGNSCSFAHGAEILQTAAATRSTLETSAPVSARPAVTMNPEEEFPVLGSAKAAPAKKIDFWGPSAPFSAAVKKKSNKKKATVNESRKPGGTIPTNTKKKVINAGAVPWVETGEAAASLYKKYRQEASELAILRNKLFQRATENYLAGNKITAKTFSMEAHAINEKVQELNDRAAEAIFAARNPGHHSAASDSSSSSSRTMIDLHGLHPSEAVILLSRKLEEIYNQHFYSPRASVRGESVKVLVVTGSGHHSRGRKAKVLPAVRDFLEDAAGSSTGGDLGFRVRFREGTMRDGKGGVFVVDLG